MTTTPRWVQSELTRVTKERTEAFEKKGWKEFFKFPVGTTVINVDMKVEPRKTNTDKPILRAFIDDKWWDVPLTPSVYGMMLPKLVEGITEFSITRVGKGKADTRYGVEAVE